MCVCSHLFLLFNTRNFFPCTASNSSLNGTDKGLGKSCEGGSLSDEAGDRRGKFLLALDFDNTLISHWQVD